MFGFQPIAFKNNIVISPPACIPVNFTITPPVFVVTVGEYDVIDLNIYNTGGTATSWLITLGSIPPGMTLNTSTGIISGTPTTESNYSTFINASNECTLDSQNISIEIQVGPGI